MGIDDMAVGESRAVLGLESRFWARQAPDTEHAAVVFSFPTQTLLRFWRSEGLPTPEVEPRHKIHRQPLRSGSCRCLGLVFSYEKSLHLEAFMEGVQHQQSLVRWDEIGKKLWYLC